VLFRSAQTMKYLLLLTFLIFLSTSTVVDEKVDFSGYQVVRLNIQNSTQREIVDQLVAKHRLDVWSEKLNDIMLPPSLLDLFTSAGIEQSIFIKDVQHIISEVHEENLKASSSDDYSALIEKHPKL